MAMTPDEIMRRLMAANGQPSPNPNYSPPGMTPFGDRAAGRPGAGVSSPYNRPIPPMNLGNRPIPQMTPGRPALPQVLGSQGMGPQSPYPSPAMLAMMMQGLFGSGTTQGMPPPGASAPAMPMPIAARQICFEDGSCCATNDGQTCAPGGTHQASPY